MSAVVATKRTPVERVKALLGALIGPSDRSLFPFIPRPIKLLVLLIFLFNKRSWPFVWHFRVFRPVLDIRWEAMRKARTALAQRRWYGEIACVNADPFEVVSVTKCYAGIDDCDYNGHLSNSCYAKNLDPARMRSATDVFPPIFKDGIWMALGGAHYHFIREIPYGVDYEIRTTIGAWEDKWMFLVHHFVTYPKPGSKYAPKSQPPKPSMTGAPSITTPSSPSLIATPMDGLSRTASAEQVTVAPYKPPASLPLHKLRTPLPPNAVVHCIAVSHYCFKIGRITVPPKAAFIGAGFGDPARKRWNRVQDLRFAKREATKDASPKSKKSGGKPWNRMSEMFKGEWRQDNEAPSPSAGFWDLPEFEPKRKERMEAIFGGLQKGFAGLGSLEKP